MQPDLPSTHEQSSNLASGGWGPFPWTHLLLPLIITALMTPAIIRHSMTYARLSAPPGYDDISYMVDAGQRILTFHQQGLLAALRGYIDKPPHAPVSTGLAATGYLLFGIQEWAPYAMNSLVLLLYLALGAYIMRQARAIERVAALAILAVLPVASMCIREFRPDCLAALLIVAGIILLVERPLLRMPTVRLLAIGGLFGAAVLAKPSTFPLTLALAGMCTVLAGIADRSEPRWTRWGCRILTRGLLVLSGIVVVAGPHCLVGGKRMYAYLHLNIFGPDRELWTVSGSRTMHLRYYLDGVGGQFMLGPFAWPLLATVLLGAMLAPFLLPRDSRRRALVIAAALGLAFATAALNQVKQQFLGLPFQLLLVFSALLTVRMIVVEGGSRLLPRFPWTAALLIALAVVSVAQFRFWNPWVAGPSRNHRAARDLTEQIYHAVDQHLDDRSGLVYFGFFGAVNETALRFRAMQDYQFVHCTSLNRARTLEEFARPIGWARIVVTAPSGSWMTNDSRPNAKLRADLIEMMEAHSDFTRIETIPIPFTQDTVNIYRRTTPRRR
jgi:hypothetical protein